MCEECNRDEVDNYTKNNQVSYTAEDCQYVYNIRLVVPAADSCTLNHAKVFENWNNTLKTSLSVTKDDKSLENQLHYDIWKSCYNQFCDPTGCQIENYTERIKRCVVAKLQASHLPLQLHKVCSNECCGKELCQGNTKNAQCIQSCLKRKQKIINTIDDSFYQALVNNKFTTYYNNGKNLLVQCQQKHCNSKRCTCNQYNSNLRKQVLQCVDQNNS